MGLLLSLAIVFTVQWLAVRIAISHLIGELITNELLEDADELLAALDLNDSKNAHFELDQIDPVFLTLHSGHYYEVLVDGVKAFTSPSLAGADLRTPAIAENTSLSRRLTRKDGTTLLVAVKGFNRQSHLVTIAIAIDLGLAEAKINTFIWRYTLLTLLMLVCLVLLQSWVVRQAFTVLARIRTELTRMRDGASGEVNEIVPTEVLPLVREINRLSKAMAQRVQRSREALGNLAHALKTPLTVLSQLAQDQELRNHPSLRGPLLEQIDSLGRRVDLELKRARLAGRIGASQIVNLCEETRALVLAMKSLYRNKQLDITCDTATEVYFQGDREDMLELLGNLLDNACKYGRRKVLVTLCEAQEITLTVEDDGPGCPPEMLDRLAQRGVRLDESVGGHGLGLAIAADIVSTYDGTIKFGRSITLGGFLVSVRFPQGQGAQNEPVP